MIRSAPTVDKPTYDIVDKIKRFDQRDHPIARDLMQPGTPEYEHYYAMHPEVKAWDDENRHIIAEKNRQKTPDEIINGHFIRANTFARRLLATKDAVEGHILAPPSMYDRSNGKRINHHPAKMSLKIKAFAAHLGAAKVGIASLKREWVVSNYAHPYSSEAYGSPVDFDYSNIICMAFIQDMKLIKCGVRLGNRVEGSWIYAYASLVSAIVAHFIRLCGWRARSLPPGNAPVLVVPCFVDAGIGEQGRCSYVVTKEFGNNFRPGMVATDMPLKLDKPVDFGLQDFCEKCLICAEACPSGSIHKGGKEVVRGVRRWTVNGDSCKRYWNQIGGGCSICQAVCPWNHPDNVFHNTVREIAQHLPFLRKPLVLGEKIMYGKYLPAANPDWLNVRGTAEG